MRQLGVWQMESVNLSQEREYYLTSLKKGGSSIHTNKTKSNPGSVLATPMQGFVLVFVCGYRRSNLFETRQMGKLGQTCENIINPSPDLLGGVPSNQT